MNHCGVCGRNTGPSRVFCSRCRLGPASLYQACLEEREGGYRLGLNDGTQMEFDRAEVRGEWVTFCRKDGFMAVPMDNPSRGIDIKLDLIVWCARDPDGLEQPEPTA